MVRYSLVAALVASSTVATAKPLASSHDPKKRASTTTTVPTVHFPLNFKYGSANKVSTAVSVPWANTTIDAVYDQGSENFWLMAPDSTVNWGCQALACQGPCNVTETSVYDYTRSSTATTEPFDSSYLYGLFDKLTMGDVAVNDTLTFVNVAGATSSVSDIRFALEYYLQNRIGIANNTCGPVPDHDVAILGVAPYQHSAMRNTTGPHVRKNLLDQGQIGANVHSMWFDQAPSGIEDTFTGGGLMGGLDTSKYTGPLVKVPYLSPELEAQAQSVGYYVAVPQVSVQNKTFPLSNESTSCFLDSGTHIDELPIPFDVQDDFLSAVGVQYDPLNYLAYPSNCEDIPSNITIDITWTGVNANETVTVKVPLRNYARGNLSPAGWCSVNFEAGGCLLGAPFSTAAFFAADDERQEVALAQGGVSVMGSTPDAASIVQRIP